MATPELCNWLTLTHGLADELDTILITPCSAEPAANHEFSWVTAWQLAVSLEEDRGELQGAGNPGRVDGICGRGGRTEWLLQSPSELSR